MLLMSLLLSVITLNPAIPARSAAGPTEGFIQAAAISPDKSCQPGDICASTTFHTNGCFFNNFWNNSTGGTPLTIDVTQTSTKNGSKVYIYWVNATNKTIGITGKASAKYYCP